MSTTSHAVAGGRWPSIAGRTEKTCSKCNRTLPLDGFYRDSHKRDGRCSSCKDCNSAQARAFYYDTRSDRLAQKAEKRKDPEWRAALRPKFREYRQRNPDKMRARGIMARAVRAGTLKRMPCEKCGDTRSQGHHLDYNKPLDVHWLCYTCHGKEHRTSPEGLAALRQGR